MQQPSLLKDWQFYLKELICPDSFIEMSFYSMMSAALQRRVWMQSTEKPLFCNMYIFLVGPAGTGKGLALDPVAKVLRGFKLFSRREKEIMEAIAKEGPQTPENTKKLLILKEMQSELETEKTKKGDNYDEPLVIPLTANATTYQKLIQAHSRAVSRFTTPEPCAFAPNRTYRHSSLTAILPEISSLFQKNSETVVEYLLAAFDCDEEYTYETIKRGTDRIYRGFLNIIGGTTVSFLQESFREKLLRDGFSSRSIFVYESKSRFERWEIPPFSEEQLAAKNRVIAHVEQLTNLFGELQFEPNAALYLKNQIEIIWPTERLNPDPTLDDYYARKNIHVKKLAAAIHFSKQPVDMYVTEEDAREAVKLLERLELNMHKALNFEGKNPLSVLQKNIVKYLFRVKAASFKELWFKFEKDLSMEQLKSLLTELQELGFVKFVTPEGETTGKYQPIKEI